MDGDNNMLFNYTEALINVENELTENYKNSFPGDMSAYRDFYDSVSTKDICDGFKLHSNGKKLPADGLTIVPIEECKVLEDITLTKGKSKF